MTHARAILYDRNRSLREMIGPVKCLLPAVKTKESEGVWSVTVTEISALFTAPDSGSGAQIGVGSDHVTISISQNTSCHSHYNQLCIEC